MTEEKQTTETQFEKVYAEFRPRRMDDLHPTAAALVGRADYFERVWEIEEGTYMGEWAMRTPPHWPANIAWVPSGDLLPVEETNDAR